MTDPHPAAAMAGEQPRIWVGESEEHSRKELLSLLPAGSSKLLSCDKFALFKEKCLDLLIEYRYRCNIYVLMAKEGFQNEMAPGME